MTVLAGLALLSVFFVQDPEPVSPEAVQWFRKGEDLIGTEAAFSDEQAEYFRKAIELAPDFAPARYNLALVYSQQAKRQLALEQLDALVDLQPQDARGYLMRARLSAELDRKRQALEDLRRVCEIEPENYRAWELLGRVNYQERNYGEAIEALKRVLDLHPSPVEAYFDLALAQQAVGETGNAIRNYQKFLVHFPDDFQTHFFMGMLYRELEQDDSALKHFLQAGGQDPNHQDLAAELGHLYLDQNDLEPARDWLLRADPNSPVVLGNLGFISKRQGNDSEAEQFLRRAIEKQPDAALWAHLGEVLYGQQRMEEATAAYQSALQHDSRDFDALYGLGTLYANRDRDQEAVDLFQRSLEIRPDDGDVYYNLGLLTDRSKNYEQAQSYYLRALENGVDRAYAHFRLGFLFASQGQAAQALQHLEIAFQRDPQKYVPEVLNELKNLRSELDSIRYRADFNDLLNKHRARM